MKAVVPVAGNGTRMFPLGVTTPKALIKILNKPLIVWTLEALLANDVEEVIFVVSAGKFGQQIQEFVESKLINNPQFPLKIHTVVQEQQLGTAHVLQMAAPFFHDKEQFLYLYGDDLYGPKNIAAVLHHEGLAVIGKKVPDPEKWGIFQTDNNSQLVKVVEKPETFVGDLANIGCMKLDARVFDLFHQLEISIRGEYEIPDTLQLLAKEGLTVLPAIDYWIPIGYPWHILEAAEYFLPHQESSIEGSIAERVVQKGRLVLPRTSTILPGCYLEGNILVGEHVVIGPNSRLIGNIAIGNYSSIGFSVEIENSVLGERVNVPRLAYVGDSVLGNDVAVGGGTMLANTRHDGETIQTLVKGQLTDTLRKRFGAVLGDGVKLSVNTTVYPGRKVWPGLSTRPGQIIEKDVLQ